MDQVLELVELRLDLASEEVMVAAEEPGPASKLPRLPLLSGAGFCPENYLVVDFGLSVERLHLIGNVMGGLYLKGLAVRLETRYRGLECLLVTGIFCLKLDHFATSFLGLNRLAVDCLVRE